MLRDAKQARSIFMPPDGDPARLLRKPQDD